MTRVSFGILVTVMALVTVLAGGYGGETLASAPAAQPVTFAEHVAPIVFKNCTPCHRPGEAAPFALQNYEDVARRGRMIAAVTKARIMPPWKAEPGSYHFKDE